jgi:hypothetical protein
MLTYPIKIDQNSGAFEPSDSGAFERIEKTINGQMANLPSGSVRIFDGTEFESRYGVTWGDFWRAMRRLGEPGYSLIVLKGDPSKLSSEKILAAALRDVRRRTFSNVPNDQREALREEGLVPHLPSPFN